jgi:hypothetical protein
MLCQIVTVGMSAPPSWITGAVAPGQWPSVLVLVGSSSCAQDHDSERGEVFVRERAHARFGGQLGAARPRGQGGVNDVSAAKSRTRHG